MQISSSKHQKTSFSDNDYVIKKKKSSGKFFNVEQILSKRIQNCKPEYLIKWEGYDIKEATWEPIKNLISIQKYLNEFDKNNEQNEENDKSEKSDKKNQRNLQRNGNFEEDEAEEIMGVYPQNGDIVALIKWKKDRNGKRPLETIISTKLVKEYAALILVNFYETKLNI